MALAQAQRLARRAGAPQAGTQHLLQAISADAESPGGVLFAVCGLPVETSREPDAGPISPASVTELAWSEPALGVLRRALEEARQMNHHCVSTEHLAVALFLECGDELAELQAVRGQIQETTEWMRRIMTVPKTGPAPAEPSSPPTRPATAEDFPPDVRTDPLVGLWIAGFGRLAPELRERDPFVVDARRRQPKTTDELMSITCTLYAASVRELRRPD